jgi:hypothetical protein
MAFAVDVVVAAPLTVTNLCRVQRARTSRAARRRSHLRSVLARFQDAVVGIE